MYSPRKRRTAAMAGRFRRLSLESLETRAMLSVSMIELGPSRAIDDKIAEGTHTGSISHLITGTVNDPMYPTTLAIPDVTVTITDNDAAGVVFSRDALGTEPIDSIDVQRGAQTHYWIALTSQPKHDVTIFFSTDNDALTAVDDANPTNAFVDFTAGDWNVPRAVRIAAGEEFVETHVTHTLVSGDPNYQGTMLLPVTGFDPTLSATVADGTLAIADIDPTDTPNEMTVTISGQDLVISDASERFLAAPEGGTLSSDGRTITIPSNLVTESLIVGLAGGVLALDFSGGNPIPAGGLAFHGEYPASGLPGGTLVLDRGTSSGLFSTITHTFVNASDGSILLDPDGGGTSASGITYTGLEPISDSLDAAHRVFSFTGGSETIVLSDAIGPDGTSLIDSTLGESVTFANPTASLIVDTTTGSGPDSIHVEGLATAFDADLIVLAKADDTVRFQTNPTDIGSGDLRVTTGDIRFTARVSTTGAARLEATSGSILGDPDGAQTDLVAATAELVASAGVGQLDGFHGSFLQLSVERIEADGGAGVLFVYNDGPLIVGGVTSELNGIVVADHASIAADGDLTITEPIVDTAGDNFLSLSGHTIHIDANILTGGSLLDVETWNDGDLVLNATIDTAGRDVFLVSDRNLIINGTLLTHGGQLAGLWALGDIFFTAESHVDAVVSLTPGLPVLEVDAGGSIHMADGALIDARDGEIKLFADGDITLGSLVSTWFVVVVSREGSILNGGDAYPNIISAAAELLTFDVGAVGTAAHPLDLQVDELFGESFAGFYVKNAGPLDIAYYGIDAGGDVWIAADGPLNVTRPIRSTGSLAVLGVGETGTGADRVGIALSDLGQMAAPAITLIADSIDLPSGASVDAGAGSVVVQPLTPGTRIDLGGADVLTGSPLTLGLTAAELDRIQAATLTIGGADSGEFQITVPLNRAAATDMTLVSGAGIVFDSGSIDTGGGTLVFDPGTAVQPLTGGTDATAGSVSFADGAALAIRIDGTEVDTEYSQLNVAGAVDLTGAVLEISGSHLPAAGDAFTIVNNAGSDPVIGTFAGLPEGAVLSDFLGSGLVATITYVGGDGNDVVLENIGGTRIDMTIVSEPTETGEGGLLAALPASADWVHEWQSFWVEIWVSTPDTTALGVAAASVDLQYFTDYLTAQEIEHGPAFTKDPTGAIHDALGLVSEIGGRTERMDAGDDAYVLLARVRFASIDEDNVPVDQGGISIGPYDMQLALDQAQTRLVGVDGLTTAELGDTPDTELWAVVYDIEDNNQIDFGDFSFFAAAFGKSVGEPASEPPYVWWADFDKSGRVDFGDLAFFAPNFGKTRLGVQSGEQTLVFPPNFPDAWRNGASGGGAGVAQLADGEGEASDAGGSKVSSDDGRQARALPRQSTLAVDEAHAALQAERSPSLSWQHGNLVGNARQDAFLAERPQGFVLGTTARHEAQPAWLLRHESSASLYSRSDRPGVSSGESSSRQFDEWEPLDEMLSSLVEPSADRLSDDLSDFHDALFTQMGG